MAEYGKSLARAISRTCRQFDATHAEKTYGVSGLPINDVVLVQTNQTSDLEVKVSVFAEGETQIFIAALFERQPDEIRRQLPYLSIHFGKNFGGFPTLDSFGDLSQWVDHPMVMAVLKLADDHSNNRLKHRLMQVRDDQYLIGQSTHLRAFASEVLARL